MRAAAELLRIEARELPVILDRAGAGAFDRPTSCAGWSVHDVVAHCGAALGHLVAGDEMIFTPEANQLDVDARTGWTHEDVVAELVTGCHEGAEIIDRLDGRADGLGLGVWVHGGDIRDALGAADAYASPGVELAVPLLVERSRRMRAPAATALVDGQSLDFGDGDGGADLTTDTETFVRLCAGRRPDAGRYRLVGAEAPDLVLFG